MFVLELYTQIVLYNWLSDVTFIIHLNVVNVPVLRENGFTNVMKTCLGK